MQVLENISGGFVILVILSLVVITIGFLRDSIWPSDEADEPKPASLTELVALSAVFVALVGYWAYDLLQLSGETELNWWSVGFRVFWIVLGSYSAYLHVTAAIKVYRAGDIQQ